MHPSMAGRVEARHCVPQQFEPRGQSQLLLLGLLLLLLVVLLVVLLLVVVVVVLVLLLLCCWGCCSARPAIASCPSLTLNPRPASVRS